MLTNQSAVSLKQRCWRWCIRHLHWLQRLACWLALFFLLLALLASWQWQQLAQRNQHMQFAQRILAVKPAPQDAYWAYARGWALQSEPETALKLWFLPEHAQDLALRTQTKFAIGNLYFDWAMAHHDIAHGGAHQQQVAMIALAREAYKDALRLNPAFSDARFNLELLDRRSPDKRTQGWQSTTDGVTLKPFKRNGTAMMRDNRRRGLP